MARLRWWGSCATWPEAISALTVTKLRSRDARSGPSHKSRNRTSVVYCTMPGATLPNCCSTAAFRLRVVVERKKRRRSGRKLTGPNLTIGKDIFLYGDCRHRISPAGVKGELRDDLRNIERFNALIK